MNGSRNGRTGASERSSGLPPKQAAFLAALLTEATVSAAARKAGVSEATARRWLAQVELQRAYREARRQLVENSLALLQRSTNAAVHTLLTLQRDGQSEAVRLRAAQLTLDYATKAVELADLAARVEALEQLLDEQRKGR
jgi:transposase-like protein